MIAQTDRIIIQRLVLQDAPFIVQLLNTPGWLKYIGDRGVKNISDAENYLLKGPLDSYEKNGFGLWMVMRKEDLRPIGMCGILKRDTLEFPDLGFAFLPEFTGQGYATESIKVILRVAATDFRLSTLSAITTPDNIDSQKALAKCGFVFFRRIVSEKDEELFLFMKSMDESIK
jgi:ribosomal-protein-alanine N-acetyltransferase